MFWIHVFMFWSILDHVHGISCKDRHYETLGGCDECPPACNTCTSPDHCITCNGSFYGTKCDKKCEPPCTSCHKVFGYCTYGCLNGMYGSQISTKCKMCPNTCKLCDSSMSCYECKPDFYGPRCQPCPDTCEECDKTTGLCSRCKAGYFNQGGSCIRCSDGCGVFSVNQTKYYNCEEGFLEQCVDVCPTIKVKYQLISERGQRCGMPTPSTCGKISSFHAYTCLIKKHCLQECSPGIECPMTDDNDTVGGCSNLMSLICIYQCRPPVHMETSNLESGESEQMCDEVCSVEEPEAGFNTSICYHGNVTVFDNAESTIEGLTTVLCIQDGDFAIKDPKSEDNQLTVFLILNLAWLVVILIPVLCWYKSRKQNLQPVHTSDMTSDGHVTIDDEEQKTADTCVQMTSPLERHSVSDRPNSDTFGRQTSEVHQGRLIRNSM